MSEGKFPWEAGMPVLKLFDAGDALLEVMGTAFLLGVAAWRSLSCCGVTHVVLWKGFHWDVFPARNCLSGCGRALSVSEQRQGSAGRAVVGKGPSPA